MARKNCRIKQKVKNLLMSSSLWTSENISFPLNLGTSSARNLELVTNELGKIEHTLYGILNHTQTPGGDRLLRANILQPPSDVNTIITRQDCIAELMDNEDLFNDLRVSIIFFWGVYVTHYFLYIKNL